MPVSALLGLDSRGRRKRSSLDGDCSRKRRRSRLTYDFDGAGESFDRELAIVLVFDGIPVLTDAARRRLDRTRGDLRVRAARRWSQRATAREREPEREWKEER